MPAPSPQLLLADRIHRVHRSDGSEIEVLKGVSLELARGEFVTVMGPSGSGKSTLLHILSGLDLPTSGEVFLAGREIGRADEATRTRVRRENVGFVFQFFNLIPDLTVEENVILPLLIARRDPKREEDRVRRLLDALGLAPVRTRLPHTLSGGEMQRTSVARALVAEPPIVFADEPTGNLSTKAGEEIIAILRRAPREFAASVLLVTHNPRDAAAGDRVLFLKDGVLDPRFALKGPDLDASHVFRRLEELGI